MLTEQKTDDRGPHDGLDVMGTVVGSQNYRKGLEMEVSPFRTGKCPLKLSANGQCAIAGESDNQCCGYCVATTVVSMPKSPKSLSTRRHG
jgi:hypothetical protein